MNERAFDVLAAEYDDTFSRSSIGFQQRMVSRKCLQNFLKDKSSLKILEINCGTGDDALWLSSLGHDVIATDRSPNMIIQAKAKLEYLSQATPLQFLVCEFNDLAESFSPHQFDLIFSNFAGLNCVSPDELNVLGEKFRSLLKPNGHMAIVLFGKYTWWESLYFLFKFQPRSAFRRWANKKTEVGVTRRIHQTVYYYSIKNFVKHLAGFSIEEKKPVGLFIPPSYLEQAMQKRKRLFKLLVKLEKRLGWLSFSTSFADHSYILLKKR